MVDDTLLSVDQHSQYQQIIYVNNKASLMIINVKENILLFHKKLAQEPNHRYRSWEHCYSYFQKKRPFNDGNDLDIATLHLAFYLASWGMYRGSSQLLQKDYRVHTLAVKEIVNSEYLGLWDLDFDNLNRNSNEISLIFELVQQLKNIYAQQNVSPTDTLVTKVLMGTIGCTPAYDRLFLYGVKRWKKLPEIYQPKFPAKFGLNSYMGLIGFYKQNRIDIEKAKEEIDNYGTEYPTMKLVDMYFWNLGYQT